MTKYYNPFSENRAEQMHDLSKLYVPFTQIRPSAKPLIIEGGRGSGKTMYFLCNSWKEQLSQLRFEERDSRELFCSPNFIGVYYKCDTAFVGAMSNRSINDKNWDGIFNTYLSTSILIELFNFFNVLASENNCNESTLLPIISKVCAKIKSNSFELRSLEDSIDLCEQVLESIENYVNEPESDINSYDFKKTITGRPIAYFISQLTKIDEYSNIMFKIFIDEYENLLEYQSMIVNTLIKHSNRNLVYNIGLRPKGMSTSKTSGSSEVIQNPHDFQLHKLDLSFDTTEKGSQQGYLNQVKEICRNRIRLAKEKNLLPSSVPEDIEFYLGNYSIADEINRLEKKGKESYKFYNDLLEIIIKSECDADKRKKYIKTLAEDAPLLNTRLHYSLLLRRNKYRPSLHELYTKYREWELGEKNEYSEWMHNTKYGIVFLLAKKNKEYYGIDVYSQLSSGVVRYLLELCEQAFDFASLEGFTWETPKRITNSAQTKAARYVSRYKYRDIEGYDPYGRNLKVFIKYLGEIFRDLHRNDKSTLGEPEPNHFHISNTQLTDKQYEIIKAAVMWNILQEEEPTKTKQQDFSRENVDFILNRIYSPYFNISYRKKRKIYLSDEILEGLLSGNDKLAELATKDFLNSKWSYAKDSSDANKTEIQTSLFDGGF